MTDLVQCFFADPPYYGLSQYKNKFKKEDHLLLRDKLCNIKGKFLLTINDSEETREWYCGFNVKKVDVPYSVCRYTEKRRKFGELIVTNY